MHLSMGTANPGDRALLESRLLYPKRGFQCLQFFYYNSGGANNQLKIWVREYDPANPDGVLRFIQTIDGNEALLSSYSCRSRLCRDLQLGGDSSVFYCTSHTEPSWSRYKGEMPQFQSGSLCLLEAVCQHFPVCSV